MTTVELLTNKLLSVAREAAQLGKMSTDWHMSVDRDLLNLVFEKLKRRGIVCDRYDGKISLKWESYTNLSDFTYRFEPE